MNIVPILKLKRGARSALVSGSLVLGLLCVPVLAFRVSAQVAGCRSDPVVTLSNGDQVTLWENISDQASDVKTVTYVLHGPRGTSVSSIAYSGAVPKSQQTLRYVANDGPMTYDSYTTISTGVAGVQISANMQVNRTMSTVAKSVTGPSGHSIHNHIKLPPA
ncbi:MAG TPA: hypothetical protein VG815_15270 [Chloroflexota bacterium]|jgi:hypothetical protein|nr:hypothetical protein [Chloroflexota bacterium]